MVFLEGVRRKKLFFLFAQYRGAGGSFKRGSGSVFVPYRFSDSRLGRGALLASFIIIWADKIV